MTMQFNAISIKCAQRARRVTAVAALVGMLASLCSPRTFGQFQYQRLKSFGSPEQSGGEPNGLLVGSDGALYGTTRTGGTNNTGIIFKLNKDGSGYTDLHNFTGTDGDGSNPAAALIEGIDRALYGTTFEGGANNLGTVFKLSKDGSGYVVLRSMGQGYGQNPETPLVEGSDGALYGTTRRGVVFKLAKDGANYVELQKLLPGLLSGLIEGRDGALYGRTYSDGAEDPGVVFKIAKDGSGYKVLHHFTGAPGDGQYGYGDLLEGSDGALYGTTYRGGTDGAGTVFKLNTDGSGYRVLRSFSSKGGDAGFPESSKLTEGANGALYGTTLYGGANGLGALFKMNKDGSGYTVLASFEENDGYEAAPSGILVSDSTGILYGTTRGGGTNHAGTIFRVNSDGSGPDLLFQFSGSGAEQGWFPRLLLGSDDALYGTTRSRWFCGVGTIFKLTKDGSGYRVLHSFTGRYCTDAAAYRQPSLIEGRDGMLYGTLEQGSIFKINKDGSGFSTLHDFRADGEDISRPAAELMQGSDGALYGATYATYVGGSNGFSGLVFRLNKDGSDYTVLHSFYLNSNDGSYPQAALIEGNDGALYGTTVDGGVHKAGSVFKLGKDGSGYKVLYSFNNGLGGFSPSALVEGSDGTLYGTTFYGGVFKLKKDGSGFMVLLSGPDILGATGLVKAGNGLLYGTAAESGRNNAGTLFRLNEDGSGFAVLHSFSGADGTWPQAALALSSDGALYGTTAHGGDMGFGTIFVLRPQPTLRSLIFLNGAATVRFKSVPGTTNQVQRAITLNERWLTLTNLVVPADGVAEFTEPAPPQPSGFYRAVAP